MALEDGVSLLNRLRMEGKNSKADVVLGLDNNLLQAATATGLFAKSGVPAGEVNVPGGWNNDTFVPFDYGWFAFVYDKNKLKNPPKSLKELVESDQKWRVIYEDPRTSTPGLGLLLWMQKVYGDNAPDAWQKLAAKTVTVTKGWSEAYGLFLKGEGDLVLSYTTSPAYHIIEEKKRELRRREFQRRPLPAGGSRGTHRRQQTAGAGGKIPEVYGFACVPECNSCRQLDVPGDQRRAAGRL
ncbi:Thiamin ABC transporter, substrate-binding component [Cronobacter sakazakii 680]|nr:Thiamin ABC transporter, substrate-binding component [Cronobacter sakazakii 680]